MNAIDPLKSHKVVSREEWPVGLNNSTKTATGFLRSY
jgi:hypothetical protein